MLEYEDWPYRVEEAGLLKEEVGDTFVCIDGAGDGFEPVFLDHQEDI